MSPTLGSKFLRGPIVEEEAHVQGVILPVLHVEGGEAAHEELQLLQVEHHQERLRDHVKEPEHELRHLARGRVEERVAHPQVHEFVAVVAGQIVSDVSELTASEDTTPPSFSAYGDEDEDTSSLFKEDEDSGSDIIGPKNESLFTVTIMA